MKKISKMLFVCLLLTTALFLTACGGSTETTCYWCGQEEECYRYSLQYLDGYNPNGSFKYGYEVEYMSPSCASECQNSGKYLSIIKYD